MHHRPTFGKHEYEQLDDILLFFMLFLLIFMIFYYLDCYLYAFLFPCNINMFHLLLSCHCGNKLDFHEHALSGVLCSYSEK